tara:strand:- start:709 stop:1185 length:477 start_codon:yes stop_codon:yes gene_type:complete
MPGPKGTPDAYVRPSVLEDVEYLAPRLRDEDVAEAQAHSGVSAYDALKIGFENCLNCGTGVLKDEPILMFGASQILPDVGMVWMLGTDKIAEGRVSVLRQSKEWLAELHEEFELLFNYVDARNEVHIKWLKWLGFSFINLHPEFGVGKLPFYEIVRIR